MEDTTNCDSCILLKTNLSFCLRHAVITLMIDSRAQIRPSSLRLSLAMDDRLDEPEPSVGRHGRRVGAMAGSS